MNSIDINAIILKSGSHKTPASGRPTEFCFNEAASMLAGEPFSDAPRCVCPSIRAVTMRFNDRCGSGPEADARRTRVLAPLLPAVIGTAGSPGLAQRRSYLGIDWGWRVALPTLIRVTVMAPWADRLVALAPIVDELSLQAARQLVYSMRDEAWSVRTKAYERLRVQYAATATADAAAADAAADAAATAAAIADAADAAADAAATAAATAAAADATAAADAAADAAAADAAADAAATAATAATAAATAATAAATAAADASPYRPFFDAAQAARKAGGGWGACYDAARKVADEAMATRVARPYLAIRDDLDAGFADLVRRMCALTE